MGMMDELKLIAVDYQARRLDFFKQQLAAARRRLDWSVKNNADENDHCEKGEVVSYYEWAVKMAEREQGTEIGWLDAVSGAAGGGVSNAETERYSD